MKLLYWVWLYVSIEAAGVILISMMLFVPLLNIACMCVCVCMCVCQYDDVTVTNCLYL